MSQRLRDRLPVRRPRPIDDRTSDDAAVDRILARLAPLPDTLSARPEFADALRARVVAQFEAQLADGRGASHRRAVPARLGRLALAGSAALLAVAGAAGAAAAAEGATPGDLLYGLKRTIEQVELALASTDRRHEVELALLGERIEELRLEAAAGDWPSVRGLCAEITAAGADILARGASLDGATDDLLEAIDEARAAAPASEQEHLDGFQIAATRLAKWDAGDRGHGGQDPDPAAPATVPPGDVAGPSDGPKPGQGQGNQGQGSQGNDNTGNHGQGQGNQGNGQGNQGNGQGNQGNGQGNQRNGQGNQGNGQGNQGNGQGNQGNGQGNQGNGQGNQGNGQGNQGNGQGNQGNGQGNQGSQGNDNPGNHGQGHGQDKGKPPKKP